MFPVLHAYTQERWNKLMIPGKISCPPSWTREYYGYLMSARNYSHQTMYECVGIEAEAIEGSSANSEGVSFYFTETVLAALPMKTDMS